MLGPAAVVLGPAAVPLLRHAHAVLLTLAAKGVHVFLQTEVDVPPPTNIAPITHDTVADVIASSTADFFVVIADRDLPKRSVQVRLNPAADFVNLSVSDLPDAVFDAWRRRLRAHHDPIGTTALAMNPNIVTEAHIESLLIACAGLPHLRRTYAALLRLVNITHNWEHQTQTLPLHHLLAASVQHLPDSPGKPAEPAFGEQQGLQAQGHVDGCRHESGSEKADEQVSTTSSETPIGEDRSDQEKGEDEDDVASQAVPAVVPSTEEPCDEAYRALVERALQEGIKAILCVHRQKEQQRTTKTSRPNPKSDLSFIWLRRSEDIRARIIRSQLLARSLHQRLVSTFDTIASLPVSPISSPRDVTKPTHLPSVVHRERLLREVNDMLPRVEEVGTRLSKRPKTRRRRKRFLESNPWSIYVQRAQADATRGKGLRLEIAGCTGDAARRPMGETWRCYACLSFNKIHAPECTACQSPCCVTEQQWLLGSTELLNKRVKDAMKTGQGAPTPWVFAPGVLPVQPLLSNGYPNGVLPAEPTRRSTRTRSPQREEDRSFVGQDLRHSPVALRDGNGAQLRQSFDLSRRYQAAMSFDDQHTTVRGDGGPVGQGNGDQGAARVTVPIRSKHAPTMRPSQVAPVRLATSAPNGPSLMDFDFSRMLPNGIRPLRAGEVRSNPQVLRSSQPTESSLDDHNITDGATSSVHVGSLPSSEAFLSTMPYGVHSGKDSNTGDFYSTSGHPELHKQSNSVPTRQSQANHQSIPKAGFPNPGLEELAKGSYEAVEDSQLFPGIGRRTSSKPIAVPAAKSKGESSQNEITSLEALAAASDAANGGTGSATKESLRAVSAVVTSGRGHSDPSGEDSPNGMYNMF